MLLYFYCFDQIHAALVSIIDLFKNTQILPTTFEQQCIFFFSFKHELLRWSFGKDNIFAIQARFSDVTNHVFKFKFMLVIYSNN